MRKAYIQPLTERNHAELSALLLTASGEQLPNELFDDYTADGDESLARRKRKDAWDDEDEEDW